MNQLIYSIIVFLFICCVGEYNYIQRLEKQNSYLNEELAISYKRIENQRQEYDNLETSYYQTWRSLGKCYYELKTFKENQVNL